MKLINKFLGFSPIFFAPPTIPILVLTRLLVPVKKIFNNVEEADIKEETITLSTQQQHPIKRRYLTALIAPAAFITLILLGAFLGHKQFAVVFTELPTCPSSSFTSTKCNSQCSPATCKKCEINPILKCVPFTEKCAKGRIKTGKCTQRGLCDYTCDCVCI